MSRRTELSSISSMRVLAFEPKMENKIMHGTATMRPIAVVFMAIAIPRASTVAFCDGSAVARAPNAC